MPTLYTIGHSNRSYADFLKILQQEHITHIIDLRVVPLSRFAPWSNAKTLRTELAKAGILYTHMPELGGRRTPVKDSINEGLRKASFRGFADFMQTPAFFSALQTLNRLVKKSDTIAIMCAEALPKNCHRSLIADAEILRGVNVLHITDHAPVYEHELTACAVADQSKRPTQLYYPKKSKRP